MRTQFETREELGIWQNYIKLHSGLRYKRPSEVFFNRLQPEKSVPDGKEVVPG
ncbi:MAG TPA: hypothetical protein O0W96_03920 [Methanocorpusculum sp.]|nr:hypothetical protein [Methanocorpusculum sp.]